MPFGGHRSEDRENKPNSSERPKSFDRPAKGLSSSSQIRFGHHWPVFGPHGSGFGLHDPRICTTWSGSRPGFEQHGPGFEQQWIWI